MGDWEGTGGGVQDDEQRMDSPVRGRRGRVAPHGRRVTTLQLELLERGAADGDGEEDREEENDESAIIHHGL